MNYYKYHKAATTRSEFQQNANHFHYELMGINEEIHNLEGLYRVDDDDFLQKEMKYRSRLADLYEKKRYYTHMCGYYTRKAHMVE